jgi:hypothetical protein
MKHSSGIRPPWAQVLLDRVANDLGLPDDPGQVGDLRAH